MAGQGYRSIANRLNAEGIRSPRSREWDLRFDGRWGLSTIRNILNNPVYVGDTVWNRRTQGKFHRVSVKGVVERRRQAATRLVEPNPKEDWIVTRNTHEPLVPRSIFDLAQDSRAQRHADGHHTKRPRGRGYYSNYLLTGLITCGDCGHKVQGYVWKSRACRRDPSLPRPRYYLCGGYVTKGRSVCKRAAYPQDLLETHLLGRLRARLEVFLKKRGEKVMRQMIREALAEAGTNPMQTLVEVRDEIARLRKDVDRLLANLTAANRDFVDEKLAEIRRRLRDLEAKEEDLQARATQTPDVGAAVEAALAHVRRLREVLAHGSIVEQKDLLRGFIAGITIQPSQRRGVITWYDLPTSLTCSGGTHDVAEKMHSASIREVIRWKHQGWMTAA